MGGDPDPPRIPWMGHYLTWTDGAASVASFPPHYELICPNPEGIGLTALAIPRGLAWRGRVTIRPKDESPLELTGWGETPVEALNACLTRTLMLIRKIWGTAAVVDHLSKEKFSC